MLLYVCGIILCKKFNILMLHYQFHRDIYLWKLIQKAGFEIETMFGGNRRDYVDVNDARDAFLYICKKIN